MNDVLAAFRRNFDFLIKSNGFTAREVAERIGTSEANISRYLSATRTPDIQMISAVADLFEVSMDWLIGRSGDTEISEISADAVKVAVLYSIASADDKHIIDLILNKYDQG